MDEAQKLIKEAEKEFANFHDADDFKRMFYPNLYTQRQEQGVSKVSMVSGVESVELRFPSKSFLLKGHLFSQETSNPCSQSSEETKQNPSAEDILKEIEND